jgi:hypothetical protein
MSSADLLEDGFPHGTRQGFENGCRGGACPAGIEHGLSCRRANMLAAGDYRYQKLSRAGATPAAIADELGLNPEIASPAPKKRASPAREHQTEDVPPTVPHPAPIESAPEERDPAPAPTSAKWAVRHAWVAFAPDGTMHGPFNDHGSAMTFVGEQLQPKPAAESKKRRPMTDTDVAELRRLHAEGVTDGMIARHLGRAQPLISSWRRKLGLPGNAEFQRGRS